MVNSHQQCWPIKTWPNLSIKLVSCQDEDEENALLSPEEILERERKKDPTARREVKKLFAAEICNLHNSILQRNSGEVLGENFDWNGHWNFFRVLCNSSCFILGLKLKRYISSEYILSVRPYLNTSSGSMVLMIFDAFARYIKVSLQFEEASKVLKALTCALRPL